MSKKIKHKKARSRGPDKKETEAIQKKLFLKSLKNLMEVLGIGDFYSEIPLAQKKQITRTRFRNFRIEVEDGAQVNRQDLHFFKGITSYFLKNASVAFGSDPQSISLNDYFSTGYTFMSFFGNIDPSSFECAGQLKEAAKEFEDFMKKEDNPFSLYLAKLIHGLLFFSSRPDRLLYSTKMGTIKLYSGGKIIGLSVCLYFRSDKPKKCQIILEKKKRVAYRVGVPGQSKENIEWVKVPHNLLVSNYSGKHEQLDMYIQSHALHRFDERIRGLDTEESLGLSLNYSLCDPTIVEYKDGSGLLEFTLRDKKFGYFVFTIIDNMLVIRTFLFLTNSGTPEGKKIDKLMGVRKIDKQYLELDTAYAFMHTDLLNSPWLCDLLVKAGCEQLCDLATDDMVDNRKAGYALDAVRYLGLPETIYSGLI